MHPYRPLYLAPPETGAPSSPELRGLAVVLILLGVLRLLPAFVSHETFGAEVTMAFAMLALGILELVSVRQRVRRWRRVRRRGLDRLTRG